MAQSHKFRKSEILLDTGRGENGLGLGFKSCPILVSWFSFHTFFLIGFVLDLYLIILF